MKYLVNICWFRTAYIFQLNMLHNRDICFFFCLALGLVCWILKMSNSNYLPVQTVPFPVKKGALHSQQNLVELISAKISFPKATHRLVPSLVHFWHCSKPENCTRKSCKCQYSAYSEFSGSMNKRLKQYSILKKICWVRLL